MEKFTGTFFCIPHTLANVTAVSNVMYMGHSMRKPGIVTTFSILGFLHFHIVQIVYSYDEYWRHNGRQKKTCATNCWNDVLECLTLIQNLQQHYFYFYQNGFLSHSTYKFTCKALLYSMVVHFKTQRFEQDIRVMLKYAHMYMYDISFKSYFLC